MSTCVNLSLVVFARQKEESKIPISNVQYRYTSPSYVPFTQLYTLAWMSTYGPLQLEK